MFRPCLANFGRTKGQEVEECDNVVDNEDAVEGDKEPGEFVTELGGGISAGR